MTASTDRLSEDTATGPVPVDGSRERLHAAVATAVEDGVAEAQRVANVVLEAFDQCDRLIDELRADNEGGDQQEPVDDLVTVTANARQRTTERLTAQAARLETFNLVLFGRTGAGKSTLIEALIGGDGLSISPSNMDWTTDIGEVRWRGCRLVDTPGIGGWGRTVDRHVLEQRAERAVADADVVLLCFDATAALADEFRKTSEWVARYGKPVVAVLNARNPRWRLPERVPTETERRKLSLTVLEHADHIRQELEKIGLPGVPVIAIHSQRATFARTSGPYRGPFAPSREQLRAAFGPDQLLHWSNLPALESLLAEALASHASELRLTMLNEQARGVLADAVAAVKGPGAAAEAQLGPMEKGIAEVLRTVGRPSDPAFVERLEHLEVARGGRFHVGLSMAEGLARDLLAQRLSPAKAEASRDAANLIDVAFATGTAIDEATIRQQVFEPLVERCERAAREVAEAVGDFVEDRMTLICGDVEADLAATTRTLVGVDGNAGRTGMKVAAGLKIGAALIGLAALPAVAIGPWVAAGVAVLSMAVAAVGDAVRKHSARRRQLTRSWARAASRRSIQQTFRDIEDQLAEEFSSAIAEAAGKQLTGDVEDAIAFRAVIDAADRINDVLDQTQTQLPEAGDARFVLTEVAGDLQRRQFPGEATADRLLWLGETWCSDPDGMTDMGTPPVDAAPPSRPKHRDHLVAALKDLDAAPHAGSGRTWLDEAISALSIDSHAADEVKPLVRVLDAHPRPRVVVVGDYSSGKSSFIRRLLMDTGSAVPRDLAIGGQPKTTSMRAVHWAHGQIIDTPGFQSAKGEHAERAQDALVGASLVIFLFNPNLVVGAADDLVSVLAGDAELGRPARLARTIFVINRADELGVDPEVDPDGFEALALRKRHELAQALNKVARSVEPDVPEIRLDRVGCVASNPYGLVGDADGDGASFDRFRSWDGMGDVLDAVQASVAEGANTADLQVLDMGADALSEVAAIRREALDTVVRKRGQARYLQVDLDACGGRGHALIDAARDELADLAVSFVARLWDEAEAARKADRGVLAARLKEWDSDPEFEQAYEEWAESVDERLQEWKRHTQDRVEERLESAEFSAVFPDASVVLETESLVGSGGSGRSRVADQSRRVLQQGAERLKVIQKDTVLTVFHRFNYKFKPWGATKMTKNLAKVGTGIGVAVAAWEIYDAVQTDRRDMAQELDARAERAKCLRLVRDYAVSFFSGGDDAEGAGVPLVDTVEAVEEKRNNVVTSLEATAADEQLLRAQIETLDRLVNGALRQLEGATQ